MEATCQTARFIQAVSRDVLMLVLTELAVSTYPTCLALVISKAPYKLRATITTSGELDGKTRPALPLLRALPRRRPQQRPVLEQSKQLEA